MSYAVRSAGFLKHAAPANPPAAAEARRPGLLTRFFNAILESREREASRDVEAFLGRRGYRFTDSIEREINQRFLAGGWDLRR